MKDGACMFTRVKLHDIRRLAVQKIKTSGMSNKTGKDDLLDKNTY